MTGWLTGVCLFFSLCLVGDGGLLAGGTQYQVGVARIDITPGYPVRLNGFGGRRGEADGVSQPLWAKALAVSSTPSEPPLVLISMDNLGIPRSMTEEVAKTLSEEFSLPRDRIALTFTHTHCGPKVNGASDTIFSSDIPADQQEHIDRYSRELPELLVRVASEAIANRLPATLEWNVGSVGFARNRRTEGGPVDHDLPMLVVRGDDGQPRAVWVSYACHCVTLSFNQYHGDWAGCAQELIEKSLPGAVAMVSIGCGSDANPSSGVTGDRVLDAAEQGRQIADEVDRLLELPGRPVRGELRARLDSLELPLAPLPSREELSALAAAGGAAGYNAGWQLARLDRGLPLVSAIDYAVQSFTFGDDLHVVFLAGEVCADYSLRLKKELHRDRVWINGYSSDFCAYIPSERLLREGGYGGGGEIPYFALPAVFQPGLEQKIIDAVKGQAPPHFHAVPGTGGIPPRSPQESLRCMATHPGLQIELVAAEPLVADPVAVDFGTDNSLWVAEMADYSRGVDETFEPAGRIRRLTDTNGDGRFDHSGEFLGGLRFPTDVKVWRDGVIVCDAPDILFAADRDGDGRAEIREVLLTGFATHNPHARVNGLRWGLDGWLHGSGALFGGTVRNPQGEVFHLSNRDFRFRPATGEVQAAAGQTQQGRPRDDWDNWFGCTNGELLLHYPVDERYAGRNPGLPPPPAVVAVPSPAHGQQLFPPRDLVLFSLSGLPGRPTSACGAEIYRDSVLGSEYSGNAFVCEPVHQLVHRLVLERKGSAFTGHRAASEQQSEFLVSTDQWFRPVQVRTGPDGALWVVDMYRLVIEHPQWIPPETRAGLDLFAGRNLGRIYRIAPRDGALRPTERIDRMDSLQLAAAMDSGNGPQRDRVHEILDSLPAIDSATAGVLTGIVRGSSWPAARVQAAATLAGHGLLESADLQRLLADSLPEVRRMALRIGESGGDDPAGFAAAATAMTRDPVPAVRIQALLTLGERNAADSTAAFAEVLLTEDPGSGAVFAALSGVASHNAFSLWSKVLRDSRAPGKLPVIRHLTRLTLSVADRTQCGEMLELLLSGTVGGDTAARWSLLGDCLSAGGRGLSAGGPEGNLEGNLEGTIGGLDPTVWNQVLDERIAALGVLRDGASPVDLRIAAIRLVAVMEDPAGWSGDNAGNSAGGKLLREQLDVRFPPDVQTAALDELSRLVAGENGDLLLADWDRVTPGLRNRLIELFLSRTNWTPRLLTAVREGRIQGSDLDAAQKERLLTHEDSGIREDAEQTLSMTLAGDRAEVVREWEAALSLAGDFGRGRGVFSRHCAACHRMDGIGHEVGPDLAALSSRTPHSLLVAIVDPNRDVEGRWLNYVAVTSGGLTVSGLLMEEAGGSVTLGEREGKRHILLRSEIDELRATRKSVMPVGMEKDLTRQDLADLIAWLVPARQPPRVFAGNQPAVVAAGADGGFILPASQAFLYGEQIVFESGSPFQNIGYWHGGNDSAVWEMEVPGEGRFDVYIDYACEPAAAGNHYRLEVHRSQLEGEVASTGGWSVYRWQPAGTVELPAGRVALVVAMQPPKRAAALFDLRQIRLVPAGSSPPPPGGEADGAGAEGRDFPVSPSGGRPVPCFAGRPIS